MTAEGPMVVVDGPLSLAAAEVEALAIQLVREPSINGTGGEAAFASFLADLLRGRPKIKAAGGAVSTHPIPGDPRGRASVVLLVAGRSSDLVMLTGHFDTVGIDDFGPNRQFACEPKLLIGRWRESARGEPATEDVESGAFLPGRGMLDMKSGIAAGLTALERRLDDPDRTAHLAMILTPDEEDQSAGMRHLAQNVLPGMLEAAGLHPVLAINLDATAEEPATGVGPIAALGSMGKVLLFGFFVGRPTHACYPAHGVNAALMAAVVAAAFETSDAFIELDQPGAPPAVTLHLRDHKDAYDVTTPTSAYAYWNVILYRRSAREILARARALSAEALERAFPGRPIRVLAFDELGTPLDDCVPEEGGSIPERIGARLRRWYAGATIEPTLVLGFASTPYPACRLQDEDGPLRASIRDSLAECSVVFGTPITEREYVPVISDLSFLAPIDRDDLAFTAGNTPGWSSLIGWSLTAGATPGVPSINLGPWGRGYHSPRERVHRRYAFEVLPAVIERVLANVEKMSRC